MKRIGSVLCSVILTFVCFGCSASKKGDDGIKSQASSKENQMVYTLSDPLATDNAKNLYKFLADNYGSRIITGQMENTWNYDCKMLNRVYEDTGKYPALLGFDYMNYTGVGYYTQTKETERAINFWNGKNLDGKEISKKHGIVAFNWHWRDPLYVKSAGTQGSFYTVETAFRIPYDTENDCWKTDSAEYKALFKDMDVIAAELLKLQAAGVPVLWRPFHEAAGNLGGGWKGASAWFWWGAGNGSFTYNDNGKEVTTGLTNADICGECYIALWKLMYDYFTKDKGLHNLIWVWNGQHQKFYPGSEYVDVIGDDIYLKQHDYSSSASAYKKYCKIDESKIVALTECGVIPSMEKIQNDKAWWSFFMVWNDGDYQDSLKGVSRLAHPNNFWSGDYFNEADHKKEVYNSKLALTLDELPDLAKSY